MLGQGVPIGVWSNSNMRQVLRILLWPLRLPVQILRRLLLTPIEHRRGGDRTVDASAIMAAVRRESAAGRGGRCPEPANPIYLDTSYPTTDEAFRAAQGHVAPGTVSPPMDHFRPAFAVVARVANRLVFKLGQPLLRIQREFNRAVLFLLRRLDADLDRIDLARHRDHVRITQLEQRVLELEQRLSQQDRAA
jgi:hypothetical protein